MPNCSIVGCSKNSSDKADAKGYDEDFPLSFHNFPANITRRDLWVSKLHKHEKLKGTPNFTNAKICSLHFETQFKKRTYNDQGKYKCQLTQDAIPTRFNFVNQKKLKKFQKSTKVDFLPSDNALTLQTTETANLQLENKQADGSIMMNYVCDNVVKQVNSTKRATIQVGQLTVVLSTGNDQINTNQEKEIPCEPVDTPNSKSVYLPNHDEKSPDLEPIGTTNPFNETAENLDDDIFKDFEMPKKETNMKFAEQEKEIRKQSLLSNLSQLQSFLNDAPIPEEYKKFIDSKVADIHVDAELYFFL